MPGMGLMVASQQHEVNIRDIAIYNRQLEQAVSCPSLVDHTLIFLANTVLAHHINIEHDLEHFVVLVLQNSNIK